MPADSVPEAKVLCGSLPVLFLEGHHPVAEPFTSYEECEGEGEL